jgi:prolyl-tRNA synthetase
MAPQQKKQKSAISPSRSENFAKWYLETIHQAGLAEHGPARGTMTLLPRGCALWENMRDTLNHAIQNMGADNVNFPLLIPLSLMQKEAEHVSGFATECAVVTHHRLKKNEQNELEPASPLTEPVIIRPTSEVLVGEAFSRWINSYRDLPLKINQWANIVRWEMRTRLFLRTSEFHWQEGHTAHSSAEEAIEQTQAALDLYLWFLKERLAIPAIAGTKTEAERFPGAVDTLTTEALMQDGKALQTGTAHFLGQHFAKAFDVQYQGEDGKEHFAWTTSWGVTTRMIGAMIMVHGDDDGIIMPPRIAHKHMAIMPLIHDDAHKDAIMTYCHKLHEHLPETYHEQTFKTHIDTRDLRPGEKRWAAIKAGYPLIAEIGRREQENDTITLQRRDNPQQKITLPLKDLRSKLPDMLDALHTLLYDRANDFQKKHTHNLTSKEALYDHFSGKDDLKGFVRAFWAGSSDDEAQLKKDLGIAIRCLPFEDAHEEGTCIITGQHGARTALFAKAY